MSDNENNGTVAHPREPVPPKKEARPEPPKEMTVAQRQKRKKMIVLPFFFLIFAGVIWLIFAPSDSDKAEIDGQSGFNIELPMPKDEAIVEDKRDAYGREAMRQKELEKMRNLQDLTSMFDQAQHNDDYGQTPSSTLNQTLPSPSSRDTRKTVSPTLQSSATAYKDVNRQLGDWYERRDDNSHTGDTQMRHRIEELEKKLEQAEADRDLETEQTALLEKSYEMAARYMPQQIGQGDITQAKQPEKNKDKTVGKEQVLAVKQVQKNVVSLLSVPLSDHELINTYSKPHNLGFYTVAGNDVSKNKNSIRACVYHTVTLTSGQEVQIRLLEPMLAGEILIPVNAIVTGVGKLSGERLEITINSIQYADNIIPVEIEVYGTDGQKGIFIPNSDEISAVKEVASTLASSAGTGIMISDNAASQLAADMGKGLVQGASQYVSKKMSVVKVTVKANHRLLLYPKQNR